MGLVFTGPPMPDSNATQTYVLAQLQARPIAAFSLISALTAIVGLVGGVAGSAITGGPTVVTLPTGVNSEICLAAGQSATLPAGATPNTTVFVDDCTQNVNGNPQLLATPETVNASIDATIAGAATYQLTLTGQGVGFRKTLAGPWQPF